MSNFRTSRLRIAVAAAAVAALAACGGDDDGGGADETIPPGALEIDALDIKFQSDAFSAEGPEVTIVYVGKGSQVHTLIVHDEAGAQIGDRLEVRNGETDTGTYDLPAGTYDLWCDIPGHRDAGMEATLTVS